MCVVNLNIVGYGLDYQQLVEINRKSLHNVMDVTRIGMSDEQLKRHLS